MAGEDVLMIRGKELKRLHVLKQVIERRLTQREAGEHLGLTDRQIRRLLRRLIEEGEKGLCHRGRGRPSNRRTAVRLKEKILRLYEHRYRGFGPTLASEKLLEREAIAISKESLRSWLKQRGLAYPRRKRRVYRRWRPRRDQRGELVQMDGSHHDWLEGRGPECVLMGYIDDASGEVYSCFYAYEGIYPAMDSFRRYILRYGVPLSVYVDRHSTYQAPSKGRLEEQIEGQRPMSHFERSLYELGVRVIPAYSPQAKGRIERLFGTFQDRLIKEMRLGAIQTMEQANNFLESYLPIYNRRFGVLPAKPADLHRPAPGQKELDRIFCLKIERRVRNDWTVAYQGKLYQIEEKILAQKITVEERLDGSLHLSYRGKSLRYKPILTQAPVPSPKRLGAKPPKPLADHPWRSFEFGKNQKRELVQTR
jgi:transposase